MSDNVLLGADFLKSSISVIKSTSAPSFFATVISKPILCNSLTSTLNDSGIPGLGILSPLTIAS